MGRLRQGWEWGVTGMERDIVGQVIEGGFVAIGESMGEWVKTGGAGVEMW